MFNRISIQTRLLGYYSILTALLVAVSTYAIVELTNLNQLTTAINSKWLAGTAMLGEMADLLSEIQIDEMHTMINVPGQTRADVEASAEEHVGSLTKMKADYAALITTDEERSLFAVFDQNTKAYLAAHHAYMAQGNLTPAERQNAEAALSAAYHAADEKVDALIELNAADAADDAAQADHIDSRALTFLTLAAAIGFFLAGWTIMLVRWRVARPLSQITSALVELASGKDVAAVPGADRNDEIGGIAKAFDVFRRHTAELIAAHKATAAAEAAAQALARHDALTGLPNRRVFSERLQDAVKQSKANGPIHAVMLLDLDRFKPVNDMYGHQVGDSVLCEIADRLKVVIHKDDTVARLGGDEFAMIVEYAGAKSGFAEAIIKTANRVIAAITTPIFIDDTRIEVGGSIGIAECPADGEDAETLLRAADIAMYRAARGTFRFFEPSMDEELKARITLEADIRRAVAADEIRPYYQPLISLSDNSLTGFEILARWPHPTRGLLLPAEFIELAEETGVIGELTYSLLRAACRDASRWPGKLMLSLNVSPTQLKDGMFPTNILAILSQAGFPPSRLQVEITETALVSDLETARSILATLQSLGIRVALDDFGTGYSSLYHLRELNLDLIKIDRSFIESINNNPESEKLVNGIVGLAKSLGLPTTAEGIEDAGTLDRMASSGCAYGQGFYFAKPMPADEADAFVRDGGDQQRVTA